MVARGWNHVDLLTEDMAGTVAFYEGVLGFEVKRRDLVEMEGVGVMQHVFIDCGGGQMIAFSSGEDAPGFPKNVDTSINKALKIGPTIHFAFEAGSEEELLEIQEKLEANGHKTRGPEDHEGWCRSVYFRDPVNGLQLEYCYLTREIGTEDDLTSRIRFRYSQTEGKVTL